MPGAGAGCPSCGRANYTASEIDQVGRGWDCDVYRAIAPMLALAAGCGAV
jgi:hypothetical protein